MSLFETQKIRAIQGGFSVKIVDDGVTVEGTIKAVPGGGFGYYLADGEFVGFYGRMSENALIDFFYAGRRKAA